MPFLRIQTNHALDDSSARTLAEQASTLVAEQLGKPERYVMVSVEHNPAMRFAASDDPLAYLELKSIGLQEDATADLSRALCSLVENRTGVSPARVYIEFAAAPRKLWGWNGGTF